MGNSSSRRRTNNNHNNNFHHHNPPSLLPSSSSTPPPPPPPPPPPSFLLAANTPYSTSPYPNPPPPPPPPPAQHPPYFQYSGGYTNCGYNGPILNRSNYHPSYYPNHNNGFVGNRPPPPPPPMVQQLNLNPAPYVDHQTAKKIRNDVNVHKDSIKFEVDEQNPECCLVSLTLDALVDGSITIIYFAKEGVDCNFMPLFPDAGMSIKVPFQKGLGQRFCQPSGTGVDLGFFELDDLSKPSPGEDVFPLVILAEASVLPLPSDEHFGQCQSAIPNSQITQAIIEKKNGGAFQVKVIKQILWVDGERYELREIYGIGKSAEGGFDDSDPGKECVICMSEPKDTAVLPCRHMCLCSGCAKELRLQTSKCPICRHPIEQLIEIKVTEDDQ